MNLIPLSPARIEQLLPIGVDDSAGFVQYRKRLLDLVIEATSHHQARLVEDELVEGDNPGQLVAAALLWLGEYVVRLGNDLHVPDASDGSVITGGTGFAQALSRATFWAPTPLIFSSSQQTNDAEHDGSTGAFDSDRHAHFDPGWRPSTLAEFTTTDTHASADGSPADAVNELVAAIFNVTTANLLRQFLHDSLTSDQPETADQIVTAVRTQLLRDVARHVLTGLNRRRQQRIRNYEDESFRKNRDSLIASRVMQDAETEDRVAAAKVALQQKQAAAAKKAAQAEGKKSGRKKGGWPATKRNEVQSSDEQILDPGALLQNVEMQDLAAALAQSKQTAEAEAIQREYEQMQMQEHQALSPPQRANSAWNPAGQGPMDTREDGVSPAADAADFLADAEAIDIEESLANVFSEVGIDDDDDDPKPPGHLRSSPPAAGHASSESDSDDEDLPGGGGVAIAGAQVSTEDSPPPTTFVSEDWHDPGSLGFSDKSFEAVDKFSGSIGIASDVDLPGEQDVFEHVDNFSGPAGSASDVDLPREQDAFEPIDKFSGPAGIASDVDQPEEQDMDLRLDQPEEHEGARDLGEADFDTQGHELEAYDFVVPRSSLPASTSMPLLPSQVEPRFLVRRRTRRQAVSDETFAPPHGTTVHRPGLGAESSSAPEQQDTSRASVDDRQASTPGQLHRSEDHARSDSPAVGVPLQDQQQRQRQTPSSAIPDSEGKAPDDAHRSSPHRAIANPINPSLERPGSSQPQRPRRSANVVSDSQQPSSSHATTSSLARRYSHSDAQRASASAPRVVGGAANPPALRPATSMPRSLLSDTRQRLERLPNVIHESHEDSPRAENTGEPATGAPSDRRRKATSPLSNEPPAVRRNLGEVLGAPEAPPAEDTEMSDPAPVPGGSGQRQSVRKRLGQIMSSEGLRQLGQTGRQLRERGSRIFDSIRSSGSARRETTATNDDFQLAAASFGNNVLLPGVVDPMTAFPPLQISSRPNSSRSNSSQPDPGPESGAMPWQRLRRRNGRASLRDTRLPEGSNIDNAAQPRETGRPLAFAEARRKNRRHGRASLRDKRSPEGGNVDSQARQREPGGLFGFLDARRGERESTMNILRLNGRLLAIRARINSDPELSALVTANIEEMFESLEAYARDGNVGMFNTTVNIVQTFLRYRSDRTELALECAFLSL